MHGDPMDWSTRRFAALLVHLVVVAAAGVVAMAFVAPATAAEAAEPVPLVAQPQPGPCGDKPCADVSTNQSPCGDRPCPEVPINQSPCGDRPCAEVPTNPGPCGDKPCADASAADVNTPTTVAGEQAPTATAAPAESSTGEGDPDAGANEGSEGVDQASRDLGDADEAAWRGSWVLPVVLIGLAAGLVVFWALRRNRVPAAGNGESGA